MTKPSILPKSLPAGSQGVIDLTLASILGARTFIGIRFTDGIGNTVTPSAGDYTIKIRPLGMDNYIAIENGTGIDATAPPISLNYAANAQDVRYTPNGVLGADFIVITISTNE